MFISPLSTFGCNVSLFSKMSCCGASEKLPLPDSHLPLLFSLLERGGDVFKVAYIDDGWYSTKFNSRVGPLKLMSMAKLDPLISMVSSE